MEILFILQCLAVSFFLFFKKGQYEQNLCQPKDTSCVPCPERLPSCVGLSDGPHYFPGRQWSAKYIICFKNRTIDESTCKGNHQYFHPVQKKCLTDVGKGICSKVNKNNLFFLKQYELKF